MTSYYADLHNHTRASDGDFSPSELVRRAAGIGLKAIGITDHDTIGGLEEAVECARDLDIEVIPGVEVSIRFKDDAFTGTLHLLCYFSQETLQDKVFKEDLAGVLSRGRGIELVTRRVKEINAVFGPKGSTPILSRELTVDQITGYSPNASRRHFALALSEIHGITKRDTINRIISNSSPAYLPSGIDLEDASELLARQPLMAVLAHPAAGSFPGEGHYKEVLPPVAVVESYLPRFLAVGLEGLEVYYPGHTATHQEKMLSWAKTHDLVVTGGSDCHDQTDRPIGVAGIDQVQFSRFKQRLLQRQES
ncbi:MAG: PHP domain-containing protein [Desulfobacteraceae bacterium]|nr:MAG: PHP domain-containing protein [Desulfobacteraceae bacterium]